MDKTSFFFTANCGVCHPGGAAMQYDRTGSLYYDRASSTYGYNGLGTLDASAQRDGDYGFINPSTGVPGTANWAKTGVSEADCLLCHMNQYATNPGTASHNNGLSWHKRAGTLRGTSVTGVANFEWAPTAGAGWANLSYVAGQSPPMASAVTIDYGLGLAAGTLVSEGGNLAIPLGKIGAVRDANCRGCHATPDGKKAGRTLLPTTDVHTAGGVGCTRCHTAPNEGVNDALGFAVENHHQIGKGDITIGSVRNDLDNTVKSCADCHLDGADALAPDPTPKHAAIPGLHFKFMKCQTCHIRHLDDDGAATPTQDIPELVIEMTSNGTQNVSIWNAYLGTDPLDPSRNLPELAGRPFRWYPAIRWYKGQLATVKPLYTAWFGEWLAGTGDGAMIRPIPLRLVRRALSASAQANPYAPGTPRDPALVLTPGAKVATGAPILYQKAEIKAFLERLSGATDTANTTTANDIVVRPVLVRADKVYYLNAAGEVEYFESAVAESHDFAVNHNVVVPRDPANPVLNPGPYGAGGCTDCHSPTSAFFYGKQLAEPAQYDYLDEAGTVPNPEAGQPKYHAHWEMMGYTAERVAFLTGARVPVYVRLDGAWGTVVATDGTSTRTFTGGTDVFAAAPGATVTLTATVGAAGGTFAGFAGCTAGATSDVCTLTVEVPASGLQNPGRLVVASFTAPPAPPPDTTARLIATVTGRGRVTGSGIECSTNAGTCGVTLNRGTSVSLTATPDAGFVLVGWEGCAAPTGNPCTLTLDRSSVVAAVFEPSEYPVAVSTAGGSGTVYGSGFNCIDNTYRCLVNAARGTVLSMTALPGPGSTFASWTGCPAPSGNVCAVTVAGAARVVANFAR